MLQYVAVCCSVLQCVAVCCRVLQCDAECCSVLQCVTVCCSVLQCVTVHIMGLDYPMTASHYGGDKWWSPSQRIVFAVHFVGHRGSCFVHFVGVSSRVQSYVKNQYDYVIKTVSFFLSL